MIGQWIVISFMACYMGLCWSCVVDLKAMYRIDVDKHPSTHQMALKHCQTFRKYYEKHVISEHTKLAFNRAVKYVDDFYANSCTPKLVVLDSGCGKAMSTLQLSQIYQNMPIIGIDRSLHRLSHNLIISKGDEDDDDKDDDTKSTFEEQIHLHYNSNIILLRADIVDFWILAACYSDWIIDKHFILYPNPYPKFKHLSRRWHGKFSYLIKAPLLTT